MITPKAAIKDLYNQFDSIIHTDQNSNSQCLRCVYLCLEQLRMRSDNIFETKYYEACIDEVKEQIAQL